MERRAMEGSARRTGGNRRSRREPSPEEKSLLADIKNRFPKLAGDMRSLWSLRGNEELRNAVEGDADLGSRYQEITEKAMERMRGMTGGSRGRSRGERGGGRRGR